MGFRLNSPTHRDENVAAWELTPLEQRVMLAADVGPAATGEQAESGTVTSASTINSSISETSRRIVFVDADVDKLQAVVAGIDPDCDIVCLQPNRSGIEQITESLRHRTGLIAVHIIAHGSAGELMIGGQCINEQTLIDCESDVQLWAKSLAAGADVMLYSCETGQGARGQSFIQRLSRLTGADVAASIDLTGSTQRGGDWELEAQTGVIESSIALNVTARQEFHALLPITIRAAGSMGDEQMALQIDGNTVATFDNVGGNANQGVFQTFTYNVDGISADRVRVRFTDDLYVPSQGIDRNLRVDNITIDGVVFETEGNSVYSTGSWKPADGIVAGNRNSEFLNANGYFQYASENVGSVVNVRASGDLGGEAFDLQINGNTVASYTASTVFSMFSFRAAQTVAADQIRIVFKNDQFDAARGIDSNLNVDWIEVDGARIQTEDASVYSTGTYVNDSISPGFGRGQTLHSNGYFQYGGTANSNPSTIQFSSDNLIVNENVGAAIVTVVRSGALDQTSTINYRVPGGFAIESEDYRSVSGTLTFLPGETTKNFSIPIINDTVAEGVETFTVELNSPQNADLGILRTTIITINDDDLVVVPGRLNLTLPSGFVAQQVDANASFSGPTGLKIAKDGRIFVTEKFGRVFVVENGRKLDTPFLDLRSQVYSVGTSQGLAGFALDPNFATNGRVYTLYTTSENGVRYGRLERFTVSSNDRNQIDLSTRTVLIGTNASNGFPDGGDIHLIGDLQFGTDGSLLISYGDAAGNGDNATAFNAQNLNNLAGKITRIDPNTGQGYASNPFFTGNANDIRSKIWAYGLRNPYRFAVRPDGSTDTADGRPGTLYIGDVMYKNNEELNISRGGENFGWPYYQGRDIFLSGGGSINHTLPAASFPRADAQTSIGGTFYLGSQWPATYQGQYFHADYTAGWIRAFTVDANNNIQSTSNFATGAFGITDLEYDPISQRVYFVALNQGNGFRGELYSITYVGGNQSTFTANQVTVGSDGSAFAIANGNEVFRRDGNSWTKLPGSFNKIAVRNANEVWALDAFGNVSKWNGSNWDYISGILLADISASSQGDVAGIGVDGRILQRIGTTWNAVSGSLVDIEAGLGGVILGVNKDGQIWRREGTTWTRISGTLKDVAVGNDGSIWGTNAANQVWQRVGNAWQQSSLSLSSISVASANNVWGVNQVGQVYHWDGSNWSSIS